MLYDSHISGGMWRWHPDLTLTESGVDVLPWLATAALPQVLQLFLNLSSRFSDICRKTPPNLIGLQQQQASPCPCQAVGWGGGFWSRPGFLGNACVPEPRLKTSAPCNSASFLLPLTRSREGGSWLQTSPDLFCVPTTQVPRDVLWRPPRLSPRP